MSNFARASGLFKSKIKIFQKFSSKLNPILIASKERLSSSSFLAFLKESMFSKSLAKLLDVPAHKVTTWYSKINKYLNKYLDSVGSDTDLKAKKKKRLIKTSDFEDFV